MKISFGNDHAGTGLRHPLIEHLETQGHTIIDHGTDDHASVDYPDFAQAVGHDVASGKADFGILICSTGIGMSISANKVKGIRAALVYNEDAAEFSRKHNNANVICMGKKYQDNETASKLVDIFLNTAFEGGRHERRVEKISAEEND